MNSTPQSDTPSECTGPMAGYWPSAWPAECGGPRRQKLVGSPGLNLQPGERLRAISRRTPGLWPVMFVQRGPGELYLQGCTQVGERKSFGWVRRVDPVTLHPLAESPRLPSGGHNWCGAAAVHANGDIYVVNGRYAHRLSPTLEVKAERELPVDNAHNGHLILPDGNLVTKDIQLDPAKKSWFTVLNEDLQPIDRLEFPENSVGRFSCDPQPDGAHLYVTSSSRVYRLLYRNGRLTIDSGWLGDYAIPGENQRFAWDSCVGSDSIWFHDMGENSMVRATLAAHPVGSNPKSWMGRLAPLLIRSGIGRLLAARARPSTGDGPARAPVRVFRFSTRDASQCDVLTPFGDPNGAIMAPPLYDPERRILVCFDTANAKIAAFRYQGPGEFEKLWQKPYRNTNQLTLYADTGELLVDDMKPLQRWDAVVMDVETGEEKGRVDTGCMMSAGMWYTPGFGRDFYTTTGFGGYARIFVE